ncbi:DUF5060 domain-containing protein, partial [bacterium]|nr:DUF5060 domain-containing protein [bacterium]
MTERIGKWDVFEVRFDGPCSGNPFKDVELLAEFSKGNRTQRVAGFYDGDGTYVVRFMPDSEGAWTFRTQSATAVLDGRQGRFECVAPSAANHGPVTVERHHHFRYADGSFYSCIGTTCYAWIHHGEEMARQTLSSLEAS